MDLDLIALYRRMADTGDNFQGLSIVQHSADIDAWIHHVGARTVLDYGSGRGNAYEPPHELHKQWGVERPFLYDPAFRTHDVLPPDGVRFDLVICCDVLEHVREADVDRVIKELFDLAQRGVWASVCCRPAKKVFPTTRENMHVTVKDYDWWEDKFLQHGDLADFALRETP